MKKIDTFVANIAQQLVDKLNKAEYCIYYDACGRQAITADAHIDLEDKCRIEAYYYWRQDDKGTDVTLYPANEKRSYFTLEDAINAKVNELLDPDDFRESVLDLESEEDMDEWQSHGFRDEADYYHWRYE